SEFVRVTVTFGTAAPLGSVTVPTIVASCANACREAKNKIAVASPRRRKPLPLDLCDSPPANMDESFMAFSKTGFCCTSNCDYSGCCEFSANSLTFSYVRCQAKNIRKRFFYNG